MASGWERLAVFEGGSVMDLARAQAADGSWHVFAATPVGVFRSVDRGQTWAPLGTGSRVAGADVATLVMGNVIQAGVKMNPARQAGVTSGLPVAVPALTVNRVCGSGAQAIARLASNAITAIARQRRK